VGRGFEYVARGAVGGCVRGGLAVDRLGKALGGGSALGCPLVPPALREPPPPVPGSPQCILTFSALTVVISDLILMVRGC
jgi:hypothetical protein